MAQYIEKAAVLAEIDKAMADEMKFYETACKEGDEEVSSSPMVYTRLQILRSRIDTLEAKEVDLDSERRKYLTEHFNVYEDGILQSKRSNLPLDTYDVIKIAKHFFELGLRNTITEEDCKLIWNIGDEIPYMPEEEFFKELLRRYKAQKGEEV